MSDKTRCGWAQSDPLMQAYHDEEWGVPVRDSRALWELLMLEGAQAGLSWITVLRKRDEYRKVFYSFDPKRVAAMTEKDVLRLLANPGIIRSRAKIEAVIAAAKIYLAMERSGEDFAAMLWAFVGGEPLQGTGAVPAQTAQSRAMAKELKKRGFKFTGAVICYAFMQASGMVNDHAQDCFRRAVVARHARKPQPD